MISPSIVSTKYGDRPLIQAPPISFDASAYPQRRGNIADANYSFANAINITPVQQRVSQPQYRPSYYHSSSNQQRRHANVVPYPIHNTPPVPTNAPAAQQYYTQAPPIQTQQQLPPLYNQSQGSYMPQSNNGSNEIHHYYGPNGQELPGPPQNSGYGQFNGTQQHMFGPQASQFHPNFNRLPANFVLEGFLEYGRLVTIEVKQSNISYRDLPDVVINDLKRMYGNVKKTHVKISGENGEFNIYGTPLTMPTEGQYQGYIYDKPHTSYSRHAHNGHKNYVDDPFTKKYDDRGHSYLAAETDPGRTYAYSEHPRAHSLPQRTSYTVNETKLPAPRPVRNY